MIITIHDDFNLQKICESGQCFRCKQIDGKFRFITLNHVLYIEPLSASSFEISCCSDDWHMIWEPYFDLSRNYADIRKLPQNDPFMSAAADAGSGIRILKQDSWEMMITFIISQRKSIPAIKKSVELLASNYGEIIHTKYEDVYSFPTPEALSNASDDELSQYGLGYRIPYIKDAIAKVLAGSVLSDSWDSYTDDVLMAMLKTVKGVGDKVANCIMLFSYGRTASAPIDTWIKKIIDKYYDGHNPFLKYEDNAGIMQQYAFYYILHHKTEV